MDGKLWAFENFLTFDTLYGCGAVGFAIDITEHRQVEQQGERLRAELAHMARVQTMGEMTSSMAHELNQPLAAVVMWAEVAAQKIRLGKPTGNDDVLKVLDDIAGQAYRAGEIIRRMKDFVRKTEPHRTTVEACEIISEALPLVASDLRHAGITLDNRVERSLPKLLVDRVQVQQVLLNLIRNAIEAMEDTAADKRRLRIRAQARDRVVEITVSDTGRGIPKDQLDCLFGTFCSTKFDGMGMGLAISRSIIEAHGGRIWAISTPQQGTSFTFTLPIPREEEKNGT
ncbi:MAG: hypothetical protein A2V70_20090 [Planctomycetes bacterium RBG_13_63_9]|nr:MAG: hypothetical protein A2V70_20090 [Planctomycetes bacterium RBG_13_63_9]